MRVLVFTLLGLAALPMAVQAADAEGCMDLKLFPRLEGCVIQECSAKHHDSLDAGGSGAPLDAGTNALSYSCPAGDLQKMRHAFDAQLRKAAYQNITPDDSDPANPALTARKGAQWIHWNANTEDGVTEYSLTLAAAPAEKFKAQTCVLTPLLSLLNQCEVEECTSKSEDSVAMPTAPAKETSLTGNVQTITLACPSLTPAQTFAAVEGQLKRSGFEILFSTREHPESAAVSAPVSSWITARTGQRWVELASIPDGESASYSLTVVPSAEILTALAPEPKAPPAPPHAQPAPPPAPNPVETAVASAVTIPAPVPASQAVPALSLPAAAPVAGFVPPKPILQVPIDPTEERVSSVAGYVVIKMLVDVSDDGSVTNAVLTGRITKDVRKLEGAALDAVSHWRFEPARQDGRVVPAVQIAVEMHFRGRPWRF